MNIRLIYKLIPTFFLKSRIYKKFRILYWKYHTNFSRYKFLLFNKFNIDLNIKKKYDSIGHNLSKSGIKIDNIDNIFSENEIILLKNIKKKSLEKIKIFEEEKKFDKLKFKKDIENLKSRGVYKPYRNDLGGYLTFRDNKIDGNLLTEYNIDVLKIGLKEEFLYLASKHLGLFPFLGRFYSWHDFPTDDKEISTQKWHKDGDDEKFFKIFIYLTDTNRQCGPFSYIKNTHNNGSNRNLGSTQEQNTDYANFKALNDTDAFNLFGEDVKQCTGDFGTIIFADTSGYHKGKKPEEEFRIMLVFEYFSQSSRYYYDLKLNDKLKNIFNKKQLAAIQKI